MPVEECVFCQIIRGERETSRIYEDDHTIAFLDIYPINRGHTLVMPKGHALDLSELDEEDGRRMFSVAQRVANALRRSDPQVEGVNLFLADGRIAGQDVFHAHLHVIPRFRRDGFGLLCPMGRPSPTREELDEVAQSIRQAL